jgi:hypothetical protein
MECSVTAYRLSRKWSILYKNTSLEKNIFQVSFKYKIKTLSGSTDPFDTRKGLRQGDSVSCILFNFSLVKIMREAVLDIKGTILHKSVDILAHADDIVIVERYENAVKDAFNRLEMEAQKKGVH